MRHPVSLYGEGLIAGGETEHWLALRDGRTVPLALERYLAPADDVDRRLLAELEGPVLDVGCGPGRHLRALAARGVFALGVDLSPVAVRLANGRGARAIVASIFDELPGGGAWRSALLLDGNIGIGGQPRRLLARLARLLADRSTLLVELSPPDAPTTSAQVRIERSDGRVSHWFSWAWVSVSDALPLASSAGFVTRRTWTAQGRWFAELAVVPEPVCPSGLALEAESRQARSVPSPCGGDSFRNGASKRGLERRVRWSSWQIPRPETRP
ncbi:MAG: class I SAM-dependent methyltransferase [Solirubrobacteraceae bacterium]